MTKGLSKQVLLIRKITMFDGSHNLSDAMSFFDNWIMTRISRDFLFRLLFLVGGGRIPFHAMTNLVVVDYEKQ